jgi:hypothetical protein
LGFDDGSRLKISGIEVAKRGGGHFGFVHGVASFEEPGLYPIAILYYNSIFGGGLEWYASIPGGPNSGAPAPTVGIVPTNVLYTAVPPPELCPSGEGLRYALAFDSLPSAQGWDYIAGGNNTEPETTIFSVSDSMLHQDSIGALLSGNGGNRYQMEHPVSSWFTSSLEVRARITADEGSPESNSNGFFFGVETAAGEQCGIGLSTSRIQAVGGVELATGVDNTQFHDYLLRCTPGVGLELYRDGVFVGAAPLDSIPVGPSILKLGDSTGATNARADVTRYEFTQCALPVPASDPWAAWMIVGVLMAVGLCVLARGVVARG